MGSASAQQVTNASAEPRAAPAALGRRRLPGGDESAGSAFTHWEIRFTTLYQLVSRGPTYSVSSPKPRALMGALSVSAPPLHKGCISVYGYLVPGTFQVINK